MTAFMKLWNLSDKLLSMFEKSCDLTASDPEILYDLYDIPAKRISEHEDGAQPDSWNVNESNIFTEDEKRR